MTASKGPLTAFEQKVLTYLEPTYDQSTHQWPHSKTVAKAIWPDSPGWTRMTGGWNGYPGKTMAASMGARLWKMQAKGLVQVTYSSTNLPLWGISSHGRRLLQEATKP